MLKFFLQKKGLIWIVILGGLAGAGIFSYKFYTASLSDSIVVTQMVTSECNRNGICESEIGENILTCEHDCRTSSFAQGGEPMPIDSVPSLWGLQVLEITKNSARVKWNTDVKSVCELRYGKNNDYENGSIAEIENSSEHSIFIENLSEASVYHFKIFCRLGEVQVSTDDYQFITLKGQDETPPENVSGLSAWYIYEDSKVVLRWENPKDDFSGVIVLRNDRYFPRDQWDGVPLCNGNVTTCDDTRVEKGKKYYYTVFSYDKSNNYSSGAVVWITIGGQVTSIAPEETATSTEAVAMLTLNDFKFEQFGRQLEYRNGHYIAKTNEKIIVYVDYNKFARVAKQATISVNIDLVDQTYLFKANKSKSAYVSDLYFETSDIYTYTIIVTDFFDNKIKLAGNLLLEGSYNDVTEALGEDIVDEVVPDMILLIILSLMIAIAIERKLKKRRKKRKKNKLADVEF